MAATKFPAFLTIEHSADGSARASFLAEINRTLDAGEERVSRFSAETRRIVEHAYGDIGRTISETVKSASSIGGALNLGGGNFRQQAAEARLLKETLDEMLQAARRLDGETGAASVATAGFVEELERQRQAATRAMQAADDQARAYQRLQAEIDRTSDASGRLAAAQREVYLEQARAENHASNYQRGLNRLVAPGLDPLDAATLNGATFSALDAQQIERGARSMDELAAATARLRAEMDPTFAIQQRFNTQMDLLEQSFREGVIAEREFVQQQAYLRQELAQNHQALFRTAEAAKQGTTANHLLVNSQRSLRVATLQAGQQVQDIAISMYSGQRASVVFAQQLPQLAFALSYLEGSANKTHDRIGRFATFLSGPWGLAVGLGVGAAVSLVSGLVDMGDEADGAGKSIGQLTADMRKQYQSSIDSARAQQAFRNSLEGVTQAIRENREELEQLNRAQDTSAQKALDNAKARLEEIKTVRDVTVVLLEEAKVRLEKTTGGLGFGNAAAASEAAQLHHQARIDIHLLQDRLDAAKVQAEIAQRNLDMANTSLAIEDATLSTEQRINREYDKRLDTLNKMGALFRQSEESIKAQAKAIEVARKADLDRARALESSKSDRQFGREVDFRQARSIAEGAGFRVTSDFRTRAEQQRLYDTVRTPQNPVALPGTSAHERGNALDIAFGRGVTPEAIRKAFDEQGVRLTKLLRETGHFHIEWSTAGADKAQREAEAIQRAQQQLAQFGERSAESVARINERFDEQPRLIDQAARATRQLDVTIADLTAGLNDSNITPGIAEQFRQAIAEAEAAKDTIQDALVRPFTDLREESERRLRIQELLARGMVDEAAVTGELFRLEDQLGSEADLRRKVEDLIVNGKTEEAAVFQRILDIYPDLKRDAAEIFRIEQQRTRELQRQQALFEAQIDVLDEARSSLTDLLSGRETNLFGNIKQAIADLRGARLFDNIFGDVFRDLENELRGRSPLGRESERFAREMNVATDVLQPFARAVQDTTAAIARSVAEGAIARPAAGPAALSALPDSFDDYRAGVLLADRAIRDLADSAVTLESAFDAVFAGRTAANDNPRTLADGTTIDDRTITVTGRRGIAGDRPPPQEIAQLSIRELSDRMAGAIVHPLIAGFSDVLGTKFTLQLKVAMSSALSGYFQAGKVGAAIGGAQGLVRAFGEDVLGHQLAETVSKTLGTALEGASTGYQTASVLKALGINVSSTGSAIGGALGSIGGEIVGGALGAALPLVGSLLGGLLGGLLSKTPKASATIGDVGGELDVTSVTGKKKLQPVARDAADQIIESLEELVDELGGTLDASLGSVSIGLRKKNFRVDPTGQGRTKGTGVLDFGEDAQAAAQAAMLDLIKDGVIAGIRQGTQNLLQNAKDLQEGLRKALSFEGVFRELRRYKDPVGAAIDDLDREFGKLIDIFEEAGASTEEYAQLEELYGIKRAEAIEQATQTISSALRDLLDDLTIGDSGLALGTRRSNALAAYEPLRARVEAGDTSAYDEFAQAARSLLEIEREIFGSQKGYFDRFNEVTELTKARIATDANVSSIAEGRDSPFDSAGRVKDEITVQTNVLGSKLDAIIENQVRRLSQESSANATVKRTGTGSVGRFYGF